MRVPRPFLLPTGSDRVSSSLPANYAISTSFLRHPQIVLVTIRLARKCNGSVTSKPRSLIEIPRSLGRVPQSRISAAKSPQRTESIPSS